MSSRDGTVTPPVIAVVAGEPSGDNLGAPLIEEIRRQSPGTRIVGIGGDRMIAAGLEPWFDLDELNVNGFIDPIKRLPRLIHILLTLRRRALDLPADCFVGVDFNFFNLLLEGLLKRRGVRTVHYVSPTVWAWRRGRIRRIARSVDLMLCLYPFETAIYREHNVGVRFVGHPRASEIKPGAGAAGQGAAREALGLPVEGPVVAMLPGSRGSEVGYSGPDFLAAARLIRQDHPDCRFVIPAARPAREVQLKEMLRDFGDLDVMLVSGESERVMTAANVVLANSGTATLEAMLLGKPMVMSYRLGNLTYRLVSSLVKTPYFALPNILAGKQLVPEFIQDAATPENLAAAVSGYLTGTDIESLLVEFDRLHRELALDSGPEAAAAVLDLASGGQHVVA